VKRLLTGGVPVYFGKFVLEEEKEGEEDLAVFLLGEKSKTLEHYFATIATEAVHGVVVLAISWPFSAVLWLLVAFLTRLQQGSLTFLEIIFQEGCNGLVCLWCLVANAKRKTNINHHHHHPTSEQRFVFLSCCLLSAMLVNRTTYTHCG
jgi:hypothetical protein